MDATTSERQAVVAALGYWNASGGLGLTLASVASASTAADAGQPPLSVQFQGAAGAFYGLYDDERGIVFVNRRLDDARGRAVTVAHELGHAFGLQHVDRRERPSLMNPGNLTLGPTEQDVAQLRRLWGDCLRREHESDAGTRR